MEFDGNAINSREQRTTHGLDSILKELDLMSDSMEQLEGNNIFNDLVESWN